jgi:amyloid beta A4 precursor protein-binding family B protein 1-interacting protein
MFRNEPIHRNKKSISPSIVAQFDELDQALATLTSTLNNVEIELGDSGNSSSSSAVSDSTAIHHHQRQNANDDKHQEIEGDEHFSDSGLSQSTDSISLPFKQSSQLRTSSQISNTSSVSSTTNFLYFYFFYFLKKKILSCDTLKNSCGENKIRLALEKMHEANIKKMFIKIHNEDKSTKNILIDETMSIYDIIILLLHKYHLQPTYNYTIVEDLPDLHIYRIFEDHENLINNAIIYWSRDTSNRICFQQHQMKYSIFTEAKKFFSIKDKLSDDILTDYISSNTIILPDDITSILYIKDKNRKIWKKYSCILRQSGIYQMPKSSSTKRDLICLLKFDSNMHLYYANNWIESLRSPTEYGFALKYAHIQKKSNKYIHYLCTNTYDECQRWINGIRIIQYGIQLYKNYQQMKNVIDNGSENLSKILPNQHYFNFIQSNRSSIMSESISTISLPINHIISDVSKVSIDYDKTLTKKNFNSLGKLIILF